MFDNKKVLSAVLAASMSTMLIPSAAFAEAADELTQAADYTAASTAQNSLSGGGFRANPAWQH